MDSLITSLPKLCHDLIVKLGCFPTKQPVEPMQINTFGAAVVQFLVSAKALMSQAFTWAEAAAQGLTHHMFSPCWRQESCQFYTVGLSNWVVQTCSKWMYWTTTQEAGKKAFSDPAAEPSATWQEKTWKDMAKPKPPQNKVLVSFSLLCFWAAAT